MTCPDCGARYDRAGECCQQRFDVLLALDHSRREPWGSRHGLAFATFALQHPSLHSEATRILAHECLTRVLTRREPLADVVADFRARQVSSRSSVAGRDVPVRRTDFAVTIASLGEFDADRYADELDAWARATLASVA